MITSAEVPTDSTINTSQKFEYGYFAELALSENIAELRTRISQLIRRLDFSDYVFIKLEGTNTPQLLLHTLPDELVMSYNKAGYFEYDMNLQRARENLEPFFQSAIHDYINNAPFISDMTSCMNEIQILNKSFGYYDYYNIPISSQHGQSRYLLSVTQRGMIPVDLQKSIAGCESTLQLLSEAIETAVAKNFSGECNKNKINGYDQVTLNPKPLKVLSTLANNDFSINEIAENLCISVVTVNQHLKTVRNRLGTKTNYAAIKQAIHSKLIQFSTQPNSSNMLG